MLSSAAGLLHLFPGALPSLQACSRFVSSLAPSLDMPPQPQQPEATPGGSISKIGALWGAGQEAKPLVQSAGVPETTVPWYRAYTRWKAVSRPEGLAAERKLLGLVSTPLDVEDVPVGPGKQDTMHTISCGPQGGPPLVILPGYGAGAGFFFKTLDGLGRVWRTHTVDLLGTGLSGRPRFTARSREEAEAFFLRGLAAWREHMGIDTMVLVGHSLGGFLAATYALQHPEQVAHLVLVCPAGVPQEAGPVETPEWARSFWSWRGQLFRLGKWGWDAGVTPGMFIRGMGPLGKRFTNGYARNRFREGLGLSEGETQAFEAYFYQIMAARGSGEHALRHLLAPFARARHPLEGRLQALPVPVSFIYGETDWMDPRVGQRVAAAVAAERGRLSPTDCQVDILERAGHSPFIDQPAHFTAVLLAQLAHLKAGPGAGSAPQQAQQGAPKQAQQAGEGDAVQIAAAAV